MEEAIGIPQAGLPFISGVTASRYDRHDVSNMKDNQPTLMGFTCFYRDNIITQETRMNNSISCNAVILCNYLPLMIRKIMTL